MFCENVHRTDFHVLASDPFPLCLNNELNFKLRKLSSSQDLVVELVSCDLLRPMQSMPYCRSAPTKRSL